MHKLSLYQGLQTPVCMMDEEGIKEQSKEFLQKILKDLHYTNTFFISLINLELCTLIIKFIAVEIWFLFVILITWG